MTCVAALGFGDIPPLAFADAFNLVASPGWIAFNIRDRYVDSACFGGSSRGCSTRGSSRSARASATPTASRSPASRCDYDAVIAEKRADVPLEWARAAGG